MLIINNELDDFDQSSFLKEINNKLFIIKEGYSDPLEGVLTYDSDGICTTFFDSGKEINSEDIYKKEKEIDTKIIELDSIIEQVKNKEIGENIKNIYINSIKSLVKKFQMMKSSIYIEATKSGFQLDDKSRESKLNNILKLQTEIYGPRVSDTPEERDMTLSAMQNKFDKNKSKLTSEETETYQNFLNDMYINYNITKKTEEEKQNTQNKDTSEIKKSYIKDKSIDKDKLKELTNKTLNLYKQYYIKNNNIQEPNWNADFDEEKKSLYLGTDEKLQIPSNYENITKDKFTKVVIGHEIEQHLFGRNNNNRILGEGFMGEGYDVISEGVAKINESIACGDVSSIDDLKSLKEKPGLGLIGILVCENYNFEQSVEILRIYHKLGVWKDESECIKKATDMVKRRKRFFDYENPGSSIKDSLYDRGKNLVIDYLTQDNDLDKAIKRYKNMSFGKLGIKEQHIIDDLKKELGVNEDQIIYTLMISRIINDKITKGIGSAREYSNPLNMEKISFSTKRELIDILRDIRSI